MVLILLQLGINQIVSVILKWIVTVHIICWVVLACHYEV